MRENVLGHGPLHAAVRLDYYVISPLILFDDMIIRYDGETLRRAAQGFRKKKVMEVVEVALRHFDDVAPVLTEMRKTEVGGQVDAGKGSSFRERSLLSRR